jgi:hypothetical protein
MRPTQTALLGVMVAAWLLGAPQAYGCECVSFGDGPPALTGYKAIFLARVESIHEIREVGKRIENDVVLTAERVWKGRRTVRWTVKTGCCPASCGYAFEVGKLYVVTAERCSRRSRVLCVTSCGLTTPAETGAALVERLDRAFKAWTLETVVQ